jgi:hypothetical protein
MKIAQNIILYIVFIICVVLLFVGGPRPGTSLSAQHIWDLGHIFLFALGSYILIKDLRFLSRQHFITQLIVIFTLSLLLGIVSEYIQVKFHRPPDVGDLGRDILGGLLAVAFLSPQRKHTSKLTLRLVQIVLVVIFLYQLLPLSEALAEEIKISPEMLVENKEFPI